MSLNLFNSNLGWFLFLDRDGVINKRIIDGYVKSWEQFEFLPGVLDAIRIFSNLFSRIIIVSNQQGVGKKLMTDREVERIHERMLQEIEQTGGRVDAVFYAPYLKSERSFMRKPNPGMALKARKQFPEINFKRSLMVGDSVTDMIFGKRVSMSTVYISDDQKIAKDNPKLINLHFPDLISFAKFLEDKTNVKSN